MSVSATRIDDDVAEEDCGCCTRRTITLPILIIIMELTRRLNFTLIEVLRRLRKRYYAA